MKQSRLQEEVERRTFVPEISLRVELHRDVLSNAKKHGRDNCDYSFPGLRKTVPEALESVPNSSINRYFNLSLRIMEAYRDVATYESHRKIQDKTKSFTRGKQVCLMYIIR